MAINEELYKKAQQVLKGNKPKRDYTYRMPLVGGKAVRAAKMPMFPKENSREQYNIKKDAGAPLTDLSYDEWKKL